MSKRLFIFMALYAEAKPLIRSLQLKRENISCGFDVYADQGSEIYLFLTGTGSIAAATAVGSCMACYGVGAGDVLINLGTCAAQRGVGDIFLCNRITEQVSGYTFYPDIWYRHDFVEAELITVPRVLEQEVLSVENMDKVEDGNCGETPSKETGKVQLYDMEAAAVYQAASYYLGPHQTCFLKIVSDTGNGRAVSAGMLTDLIERNSDRILGQIEWLRQPASGWGAAMIEVGGAERQFVFDSQWQVECERLCEELHCSQTMRAAVEQCVRYWTLAGVDYQKTLRQMREDGLLPCRDKREGKQRFEELKRQLL